MKRKISVKKILIFLGFLIILAGIAFATFMLLKPEDNMKNSSKQNEPKPVKPEPPKEKVDIIDVDSKTRPFAVVINNTPVAVKVQEGLKQAYIVYEIPTEGSTSRLMALYKDVEENVTIGTIRSVRHNFIDLARESDSILVGYGWSSHAKYQLQNKHTIDYMNGMVHSKPFWRSNPEGLASEHTAYTSMDKIKSFAYNDKKYKKESENTSLLKYNVKDIDLSTREDAKVANTVTLPYGSVTTKFTYDQESKMYTRIVNGTTAKDHKTKEDVTTKNIIVQKITYKMCPDNYYWDLQIVSSGNGYYITNGYSIPIKWSKASSGAKTKFTDMKGNELEVSDGKTFIEIHVTSRTATIN